MKNNDINSKPLVSVVMLAFNHEKYIQDAIESVLAQKTTFEYEIIIHDDASTDRTADVIKKYADKYSLIRAIYQVDNQYSQGVDIAWEFIYPKCRGKYYAYCECDDYWIDDKKLQKQVDFLEQNDKYSAVYHNCKIVDENNNTISDYSGIYCEKKDTDYDLLRLGLTGDYPGQTASAMIRATLLDIDDNEREDFIKVRANGDKKMLILAALSGPIHVLSWKMSAHRIVTSGGDSWSARTYGKNLSGIIFQANYDLNKFVKKHSSYSSLFNNYQLFHSALAVLAKKLYLPTDDNKNTYRAVLNNFKGRIHFLTYILKMACTGIPLRVISKIKYSRS